MTEAARAVEHCAFEPWLVRVYLHMVCEYIEKLELESLEMYGGAGAELGGSFHLPLRTTPTASWPICESEWRNRDRRG